MLDAGEELFLDGGANHLKLNLIIEKSGSSTGSFYARFGDMDGYLNALHNRAIQRTEEKLFEVIQKAAAEENVLDILNTYFLELIKVLRRYKSTFYFFAVGNSQVKSFREDGSRFVLAAQDNLMNLISPYLSKSSAPEVTRRLNMLARLVTAMGFQQIMFEQKEISVLKLSDKAFARELALILSESLTSFLNKSKTRD
jgi:AcrR family transcriptional regulator